VFPFRGDIGNAYRACPLPDVHGLRWGKQVELFLSTYTNKVDRKGRVSVPATFRSSLATHRHPNIVILFPSLKLAALDGSGSDYMEDLQSRLAQLDPLSDEYDDLSLMFADAHQLAIDGDGRIVLPETLKEHAQIADEAAFVGRGATFQVWEPARYAAHRDASRERALRQRPSIPPGGRA
jgi:MraZ protein